MRLEGKIAIVVGAGQSPGEGMGNGRATVLRFAREGAKVLAVDHNLASAEETAALVSRENPIEMLDAYNVRDGQIQMYIAYGGRDQFNIDAQVESFLYRARERGLTVGVGYDPRGKHDMATALKLLPATIDWLGEKLMPYGPTR